MTINQIIEPYLIALLQAVLVALGGVIITALVKGKKRIEDWLEAHTTAAQREILAKLAEDAYAFGEQTNKDYKGSVKLGKAVMYVRDRIPDKYQTPTQDIIAAVQKAWIQLDPKSRLGIQLPETNKEPVIVADDTPSTEP